MDDMRSTLTSTWALQSAGVQWAGSTVVSPTLTTLVTKETPSDGSDAADDEDMPCGSMKEVTETILVTDETLPVVSETNT